MHFIEWHESFSVENNEIDEQHKKWIEIYNKMYEALISNKTGEMSAATINSLQAMYAYTQQHFKLEEEYMRSISFSQQVAHWRIHKDFEKLIYEYNRKIKTEEFVLSTEVLTIIKDWLLDHILNEDQKYRHFLEEK